MYQKGNNASKSKTRLYNIWKMMRKRCRCKTRNDYKYYGGKGIKVCEEWDDPDVGYDNFHIWAIENGYNDKLTIDRIDNDKDYCPENCRWTTMRRQAYNRSTTKSPIPDNINLMTMTYKGKTLTFREWSEITGIAIKTLRRRRDRGWTVKETLEVPVKNCYNKPTEKQKGEGLMFNGREEKIYITDDMSIPAKIFPDGQDHVITIDGVEWVRTKNPVHAAVLFQMMVDNIVDYVDYSPNI